MARLLLAIVIIMKLLLHCIIRSFRFHSCWTWIIPILIWPSLHYLLVARPFVRRECSLHFVCRIDRVPPRTGNGPSSYHRSNPTLVVERVNHLVYLVQSYDRHVSVPPWPGSRWSWCVRGEWPRSSRLATRPYVDRPVSIIYWIRVDDASFQSLCWMSAFAAVIHRRSIR